MKLTDEDADRFTWALKKAHMSAAGKHGAAIEHMRQQRNNASAKARAEAAAEHMHQLERIAMHLGLNIHGSDYRKTHDADLVAMSKETT